MILVDSSVWIAHLRGYQTVATTKLAAAAAREPLLIGDLILLELLQGARDEAHAARIERELRHYLLVPLLSTDLAPRAALNYRRLRELGITIRKTADALGVVARAWGMSQLAEETGLTRQAPYKALSSDGNPEFATILKVMRAFGLRLHLEPTSAA
ncbi:MAG: addiction module antidote protein [Aliidongia sp.]